MEELNNNELLDQEQTEEKETFTKEEFLKLLERFYSMEEQEKYGVVAILFRKD